MEYEDTFEKDTFRFLFVENQRRQSMWFKGSMYDKVCATFCL